MWKRTSKIKAITGILIAALFGYGLIDLFLSRFRTGDIYPPYSSFRSDPLGTRALYEGLSDIDTISVKRNFDSPHFQGRSGDESILVSGVSPDFIVRHNPPFVQLVRQLAAKGGNLVVTLNPGMDFPGDFVMESSLGAFLGVKVKKGFRSSGAARKVSDDKGLPETIKWPSPYFFTTDSPSWEVMYKNGRQAAIIRRSFGKGVVVFCADSYFLSNEAMVKDRHPSLIADILGPNRSVVFDEWHFGIRKHPGIMGLAWKYRLQGFFSGAILLAVLFIWKQMTPFLPPEYEDTESAAHVLSDADAARGMVNLLRRNIPPEEILAECVREWKSRERPDSAKAGLIQTIMEKESLTGYRPENSVAAYRSVHRILRKEIPHVQ